MKIVRQIYKGVYYAFVIVFLLLIILFTATLLPIPQNIETKIVQSGSMEPRLPVGSLVVIKPTSDYEVGDIITFGEDTPTKIPTTHRIVDIRRDDGKQSFVTKGDANDSIDRELVQSDEVIGQVLFHIPYIGYVIDFARQPIGFFLLVIIPALVIAFEELWNIAREIFKKKTKDDNQQNLDGKDKTNDKSE